MRDHKDSRIQWLWEQGKIAEEDGVVGFQKGKFDISDAGMVMYWITGANTENSGYRESTVHDVRKLLENYVAGDGVQPVMSRAEIEAGLKSRDRALYILED